MNIDNKHLCRLTNDNFKYQPHFFKIFKCPYGQNTFHASNPSIMPYMTPNPFVNDFGGLMILRFVVQDLFQSLDHCKQFLESRNSTISCCSVVFQLWCASVCAAHLHASVFACWYGSCSHRFKRCLNINLPFFLACMSHGCSECLSLLPRCSHRQSLFAHQVL